VRSASFPKPAKPGVRESRDWASPPSRVTPAISLAFRGVSQTGKTANVADKETLLSVLSPKRSNFPPGGR